MKRMIMMLLLLLGMVSITAGPVLAGEGSADAPVSIRLTTKSQQGNPGDIITVSGSGAVPSLSVFVTLAPQADSAAGALATEEVIPAADGTFSAILAIPGDTADGLYAVRAEQFSVNGNVLQFYWNGFVVGTGGGELVLPAGGAPLDPSPATGPAALALLLIVGLLVRGMYVTVTGL